MPSFELKYMIPLSPITKKNHQRIMRNRKTGRIFVGQSERFNQYETEAGYFLRNKPQKPISIPVTVKCLFYTETRRPVDKSNLEEAIHDILVKYKILLDDCRDIIASTDGSRVYWDKQQPRTEIYITPFEEKYEVWRQREE